MRALKIVGFAIGGLVVVVVLLLAAVWMFVDPNDYKDRIAAGVKSSTGRDLALTGDIKLTVFPWVGLTLGPASLGNPPGFGTEPFATVQHASLRVRLLPLLRKELQVGRVEIEGLDLRLKQNAQGKGNWEFGDEKQAANASSGPSQPLDLAGLTIANSRIAFDQLVASEVNLDVGHVAPGVAVPVKARAVLKTQPSAQPMPVSAAFDATLDAAQDRYALARLALAGSLTPEGGKSALPWKFSSPQVSLDLKAQTLASTAFEAQFGSAKIAGHVEGSKLLDAPALGGDFTLQPLSLKGLLGELGIAPPVTRDPKVLGTLGATGRFTYAGNDARAEALKVKLDDSSLDGRFGLNLESGLMAFDLALDRIDADRYLPPPSAAPPAGKKSEPFELPVDALKPLKAKGQLAIGQVKIADLHLSNVKVGIDANDGVTRIAPAQAQLYGGQYSGEVSIDARPATPRLAIEQTMNGIDVAPLMNDFLQTRRLSGKGTVTAKLTASGRNSDALTRTLDGKVWMNLVNGAVEGIDLWYAIAQAQSLIQKRQPASASNSGKTSFETFKASADIVDGVATTNDLAIASELLRVTGKGTSNLATQAIDYQVTTTVLKAPPGAEGDAAGLTLAAIPVNVTGTFENPKVRPDLEGIAKARLKQEVEKQKGKIEEQVRDKVQDKLRNLFNR